MGVIFRRFISCVIVFSACSFCPGLSCYIVQNITAGGDMKLESPQWSVQENALYWVDNFGQQLFRLDGATGEITTRNVSYGPTTCIVPVRDNPGYVVVGVRTSLYILKWGAPGGDLALRQLTTVDSGKPDNRINDAKADAKGRLWFGTYDKLDSSLPFMVVLDQGTFYSINNYNFADPLIQLRPVSLSNGIGFSLDNKKMYYNDSPTRKVAVFDFDLESGSIGNRSTFFDFDKFNIPGIPDGLTVDADGNVWVATFQGKLILEIDITGALNRKIPLPVDQVSSVMWGGPNLTTLFATTGRMIMENPQPHSGALFTITGLGNSGVPENQFYFPKAPTY